MAYTAKLVRNTGALAMECNHHRLFIQENRRGFESVKQTVFAVSLKPACVKTDLTVELKGLIDMEYESFRNRENLQNLKHHFYLLAFNPTFTCIRYLLPMS